MEINLEIRKGQRPNTIGPMPHMQTNQQSSREIYNKLSHSLFSIMDIIEKPSRMSLPGAKGLFVQNKENIKSHIIKQSNGELGHIHPDPELGSLHLFVDLNLAKKIVEKEWGEYHPLNEKGVMPPNLVMIYSPRDEFEINIIESFVKNSYNFALGI